MKALQIFSDTDSWPMVLASGTEHAGAHSSAFVALR